MMQTRWEIVRDLKTRLGVKNAFGSLKRVWKFKKAFEV
jgi:hypothetical protein